MSVSCAPSIVGTSAKELEIALLVFPTGGLPLMYLRQVLIIWLFLLEI